MAQALLEVTKLRLVFEAGMDDEGNPILKAKTFSNVTKVATADQLSQAALALAALCNDTLNNFKSIQGCFLVFFTHLPPSKKLINLPQNSGGANELRPCFEQATRTFPMVHAVLNHKKGAPQIGTPLVLKLT
jgi:hypothetical protein